MESVFSPVSDAVVSLLERATSEADEPMIGTIISVIVVISSTTLLGSLFTQRWKRVKNWSRLPFVSWIVFAIFIDSWLFVLVTAILKFGVGLASSFGVCQGAILLCLVCYLTSKLVYLFLVEKAHIIRSGSVAKSRLQSKLYCFNCFGMLGLYLVVAVLNFVFRITYLKDGNCIIGMERVAMVPLLSFDMAVNVYLTILFLLPLRQLYSFRNVQRTAANERLRTVAFRTFVGAVTTTVSSVANLTVLTALNGEAGWVCLLCCNLDIAFSTIMVHWVTSKDRSSASGGNSSNEYAQHYGKGNGGGDTESRAGASRMTKESGVCQHECKHGCGIIDGAAVLLSPRMGASDKKSGSVGVMLASGPGSPAVDQGDFRKYGNMFARMDPLDDGSDGDSPGGSGHGGDFELVVRTNNEGQGGEAASAGLGVAPWNVGKETTVLVESTVVQDKEIKGGRSGFGTRTVITSPKSGAGINDVSGGGRTGTERTDWYAHRRNQDSFDNGTNDIAWGGTLSSKGSTAELTSHNN